MTLRDTQYIGIEGGGDTSLLFFLFQCVSGLACQRVWAARHEKGRHSMREGMVMWAWCIWCTCHALWCGGTHNSNTLDTVTRDVHTPQSCRTWTPRRTCAAPTRAILPSPVITFCHRLGHGMCACAMRHSYDRWHARHSPCPSVPMYMSLGFS